MGKSTLLIGVFICCVALVAALDISRDEAMRLKEALNKVDKTELYDSFRDTICQAGPKVSTVQFNENTMLEIGPQIKSGVTVLSTRKYSGDNVYSYDELKAAFAAAPEDSTGYCSKTIEDVTDIANNNAKGCSGSDKNVAYMLQSVFTVSAGEEGVWGFKFGVDCNFGSSISVDGVVTKNIFAFQGNSVDFYFNKEFNSASQYGVLNANRYLSAGIHNVEVLCLKGTTPMRTMSMIFSKPHGTFQPYNVNNLAIPVDPQFGMVEFDTNQFNSSSVAQAQIIPTWIDVSQVVQKYLRCLINVEDFTGISNSNEKGCNGADNKNAYSIRSNIPVGVCDSGDWKFKLKTTFSSGGAMFMDGNLVKYISPETFATNPVLEATVKLAPGTHTLWFVGFTNDVDEPMDLQFARPNGQYQAYTRNAIINGKCASATVDYSVQLADCQKNVTNVISDLQKCTTQLTTPPVFTLPKAVVSGLVTYESRKYDGTQMLNSQDAIKVWNNAKTTTGCCTKTVKKFELLKNDSPELCGNTGTVDNLAMKIQSTFYVENGEEGTWRFRLGIDYGKGGSMFIDDQLLYEDYRPENKNTNAVHRWWEENWNSKMAGIFEKSVYLGVGIHTLTSFGFEDCCTGRMTFQFAKPGKDYVPLGVDSFNSNTKVTDLKTQVDTFSRFVVPGYWRYESRSFTGASNSIPSLLANWNAATPTADTCTSVLPQFTMQNNQKICGRNPGNLGMKFETMIEVLPTEADAVWKIRAGIDFGRGGAMFIDDMPVAQKFPGQVSGDIWWGINWNNKNGVLEASVSLKAGTHTITFLGFEDCCGGEMSVEVAKGSDVYVPLGASLYSKKTCQVYLYKHCNYDGYIISLPPGDYKLADLQKKGFINDDISAIKVERGCWARMYRDYDLTGPTLDAVGDLSCFLNYPLSGSNSGTWNDQVSSVSIYTTTPPAGAKGTLPVQMNLLSANQ